MEDQYFMKKALELAKQALGVGEFPVGCVVVYKHRIIVSGTRSGTKEEDFNEVDHAEMVALRRIACVAEKIDRQKLTLYCTLEPCMMCYGAIILNRIGKLVYAYEDVMGGATQSDLTQLKPLYKNARISILRNIMRSESVNLLKSFFSNPANTYWQGSVLAKYTLCQ